MTPAEGTHDWLIRSLLHIKKSARLHGSRLTYNKGGLTTTPLVRVTVALTVSTAGLESLQREKKGNPTVKWTQTYSKGKLVLLAAGKVGSEQNTGWRDGREDVAHVCELCLRHTLKADASGFNHTQQICQSTRGGGEGAVTEFESAYYKSSLVIVCGRDDGFKKGSEGIFKNSPLFNLRKKI